MELVDESLWQSADAGQYIVSRPTPASPSGIPPHTDGVIQPARPIRYDQPAQHPLQAVIDRASHLLRAQVSVLDASEQVVAASAPRLVGQLWSRARSKAATNVVRTAINLYGAHFTLVAELRRDEATPPHVAQALIELIVNEERHRSSIPDARQLKERFIYELLFKHGADENDLLRQGQMLGIDLMQTRAVLLIDATTYILQQEVTGGAVSSLQPDERLQRRVNAIIANIVDYFRLPNDNICAYIGGGEIVLLKASGAKDLRDWARDDRHDERVREQAGASWADLTALKRAGEGLLVHLQQAIQSDITIGIGRYHPGVRGLSRSYQDARAAVQLGRHFQGANRLHCLDGLGAAAFIGVSEEQTKIDLARHLLSPLDQDAELLETVRVFFAADCSPSLTAQRLIIHRNTLTYRLDKVALLTGLDPRHFDDAIQIRLALLLRTLQHDQTTPAS